MSEVPRINPRRPVRLGPGGLRRIVLGEKGSGDPRDATGDREGGRQGKPRRLSRVPQRWLMAVVHSDRGGLDDHAREAIAAAAIIAEAETGVIVVVLGEFDGELGSLGADKVAVVPQFDVSRYQPQAEEAVVKAMIESFSPAHIFMPDNAFGTGDLGRRLIAKTADVAAARVSELDSRHVGITWGGAGVRANAPLPRIVLLEPGVCDIGLPFAGAGERIDTPLPGVRSEIIRTVHFERLNATSVALEEADCIVSAGNGIHDVAAVEGLAHALDAAVGASRVAVDEGRFPRDRQIGASGKTVSATTYIAVGISGAVQHLQGIKACRHVIAINRDPGAPIAKRADLTIIADAEELVSALTTRVAQARNQSESAEPKP
jgi:electron transfer flavoprotein alpha subunit